MVARGQPSEAIGSGDREVETAGGFCFHNRRVLRGSGQYAFDVEAAGSGVPLGGVAQGPDGRWRRLSDPTPTWYATREEAAAALVRLNLGRRR